ncbi:MAG: MarR family transcriptional regulator [Acidimicrobiia bacterium]|nr:MarR family transcriptional regulator [Acidimicrobiia bacterium]
MSPTRLTDADYRRLLELRGGLRRFLKWSADLAADSGVTSSQHQLLLVARAHEIPKGPTVGDIATELLTRHHSVVELVNRCENAGLVVREPDDDDQRMVRVRLTAQGRDILDRLTELHIAELNRLAPSIAPMWAGLDPEDPEA